MSLTLVILVVQVLDAQTHAADKRYSGTGSSTGRDIEQIKVQALNGARADALEKAGIEVSSGRFSFKSESDSKLVEVRKASNWRYLDGGPPEFAFLVPPS